MIVSAVQRDAFYQISRFAFDAIGVQPLAAELGVFKGDNSASLLATLNPKHLTLLDTWSADEFKNAIKDETGQMEPWLDDPSALNAYYGGQTDQQVFWDRLHSGVSSRFADQSQVTVIKGNSATLHKRAAQQTVALGKYDFLYVDGNHRFEPVFRDLMLYSELVGDNGIIQMNDCSHSALGLRQNLGVLEATVRFLKLGGWEPIAINTNDFADLLMARKNSPMANKLKELFFASNLNYIEVPAALLANARIVRGEHKFILSFD